ncbi:MAG: fumarate hydratase C-terminal domain-containing protein [Aquisalimonadaceae bacterium]
MATYRLKIPLTAEDAEKLRVGDIVYLDGLIHTGRALVYEHILDKGNEPPVDLARVSNVQMHAAPAGQEDEESPDGYRISAIQATASFRYWRWVPDYVRRFEIRAVIGKAGMDQSIYRDVFSRTGTVYLTTVGYGAAALYGRAVKRVQAVHWKEELGLPEAMWLIEVDNFGPFIVDGDTTGASLAAQSLEKINPNFARVYATLPQHVLKRMGEITQDLEHEVIVGAPGCPDPDNDGRPPK